MSNPIFVGMPSYHDIEKLNKSFSVLYQAAENDSNFIIYLSRDEKMSINHSLLRNNVIVKMMPSENGSLKNIFLDQLRAFRESDASLFVTLPDDLTFAPNRWDRKLVDKLSILHNTTYALYSNSTLRERFQQVFSQCYVLNNFESLIGPSRFRTLSNKHFPQWDLKKDSPELDFVIIYHLSEMFPVFDKKFGEYVEKAFQHPDHHVCIEMVVAGLIQQLYKYHNINRYACYSEDGFDCLDQRSIDSRSKRWPLNMRCIKELADQMFQDIKNNEF